jgi:protein-tyrosine phosphatase
MAEAMMRQLIAKKLGCKPEETEQRGVIVASAGVSASPGGVAAPEAVEVLRSRGLDLSRHESQPLGEKLVRHADLILALTNAHRQAIIRRWPEASARTAVLRMDRGDIEDPIGGPVEMYTQCAEQIEEALRERVEHLDLK